MKSGHAEEEWGPSAVMSFQWLVVDSTAMEPTGPKDQAVRAFAACWLALP